LFVTESKTKTNKQTRKEAMVSLWALGEISPFPSSNSCLCIFVSNPLPYTVYFTGHGFSSYLFWWLF